MNDYNTVYGEDCVLMDNLVQYLFVCIGSNLYKSVPSVPLKSGGKREDEVHTIPPCFGCSG